MNVLDTAIKVLSMMAYAIPGFLFVKCKTLSSSQIAPFSKVLVYLCQPCLEVYAFLSADCTPALLSKMGWFFLLCTGAQLAVLGVVCLLPGDRKETCRRVSGAASVFGNVGFIGIPLLEALLPAEAAPDAVALSAVFALSMNLLAWTAGLFLMTGERKHIRLKGLLLNPAMLAFYVAFPLFLMGVKLPEALDTTISLAGKMSTPLCMIALGMRLAATPFRRIVTDKYAWFSCLGKLVFMPLLTLVCLKLLPFDMYFNATLFLLCCCPTAAVVQNFSEIYLPENETAGKHTAADAILLSNLLCIVTIPLLAALL